MDFHPKHLQRKIRDREPRCLSFFDVEFVLSGAHLPGLLDESLLRPLVVDRDHLEGFLA